MQSGAWARVLPDGGAWLLSAAAAALLVTACHRVQQAPGAADLVLLNGKIVTVDDDLAMAEALAAQGPWITAVGSTRQIEPWIGEQTRVIDLRGRLAIPGFIEGHGHLMDLGESKIFLELGSVESWEQIVGLVAEAAALSEPGEWVVGRGWHQEKWTSYPTELVDGMPVHRELSARTPRNPVLLTHASGHAAFANAEAMRLAGVDAETPDPPGGTLVRDPNGEPTGALRETAEALVLAALEREREARSPEAVEAANRRLVELAGEEALARGVTSFHDAGASFDTIDLFKKLEHEGALPVRLYVMVRFETNEEMQARLSEYRQEAQGNDFLAVRSIKRQIDGALGSHGAWLLEPYEDLPESEGLVLESEDEIRRTAELALEHGYQLNTHAIGDRANRVVLDLYAEAFDRRAGDADLRWRIEHAQHLSPEDVGRFEQLGVVASVQGVHCTSDAPWVLKRLGHRRAEEGAYLWRSLIDSGALLINGTDAPVESIDPIANFHASVSRRTRSGDDFFPEQAMTRQEALATYTINAAYAAFEERLKGSLEVGKLADIVVLSQDLMTVPTDEIPATRVDMTILGGQVRYAR